MPVRKRLCEAKARELLAGTNTTTPPIDIEAIASAVLLRIVLAERSEHHGRALLDRGEIRVDDSEPLAARRFSVGHEIGHYILHRDGFVFSEHEDPESELYASDPDKEIEREADYFSSVLLVAPAWLSKDVATGMMPPELARRYGVSTTVIFIALEQHRLLRRVV